MSRLALFCVALALITATGSGCATAYRCYPGCRVPCKYCAPRPLPYSSYFDCACHSTAAERYAFPEPGTVGEEHIRTEAPDGWQVQGPWQ